MAKRMVETEFAFDIGDVVQLKAWTYTQARDWSLGSGYRESQPSCVYVIIELLVQVCEGGLQRKYGARPANAAGHCTNNAFTFLESELELAQPLAVRKEKDEKTEKAEK